MRTRSEKGDVGSKAGPPTTVRRANGCNAALWAVHKTATAEANQRCLAARLAGTACVSQGDFSRLPEAFLGSKRRLSSGHGCVEQEPSTPR